MGYTTDFSGRFELNKELTPKMAQYLKLFNETRRMGRDTDEVFGVQGEFFVFGGGDFAFLNYSNSAVDAGYLVFEKNGNTWKKVHQQVYLDFENAF